MGLGGDNQPVTRYNGLRTSEALLGTPVVVGIGQVRMSWKLLWYGAFSSQVAKQAGGSGASKGGTNYVYSASVIGAVCMGPCSSFLGVWDSIGRYAMDTSTEIAVLPGSGSITYTPINQANYKQDLGVGLVTAYSVVANDYGSPGSTTLAGTQNVPLKYTTNPTPPPGYYTITGLPTTPVYVFNSAQAGASVVIVYVAYRYLIQEEENDIAAATVTVQYQSEYNEDIGVTFYPSGVALTKVGGTPTVTGTYNPNGGNYKFAAVDFGQAVTISYTYKDPNTDSNAPNTLNLTFFGGALGQSPWSYLTSGFPSQALGYSEIAYVASLGMYLGFSPVLPQLNFEILCPFSFGAGIPDANPADAIYGLLTNPSYKYNFPATNIDKSLLGSYSIPGSVTSGVFVPGEVLLQSSTGAEANLISATAPMTVGLLYGAAAPDASHTWVGQTSGAVYTPTSVPLFQGGSAARAQWSANSFFISDILDSQTSLMDTISRWCEAGQVYVSWDEGMLKFIPLCDTTVVGNGVTYSPPTQPVIDIDDNDFFPGKGKDPITFSQTPWQNRWNRVNVRWSVRTNDYNTDILQVQDEASVQQYGLISESPQDWQFICTEAAAQFAANLRLQRMSAIYTTYKFTLKSNFAFLSPGDIITLTDGQLGTSGTLFGRTPVRITKMSDDPRTGIAIEAENFPWSVGAALLGNPQAQLPSNTLDGPQEDPGDTVPVIFELPNQAAQFQGGKIYIFGNGSNVNWGGFDAYVSLNGTDYNFYGRYSTPARIGITTADLPAHADPDNTNTLTVNMQQSGAVLQSVTAADRDAFVTLSAIVSPGASITPQNPAGLGTNIGTSASGSSQGSAGPNALASVSDVAPGGPSVAWTNPNGVLASSTFATSALTATTGTPSEVTDLLLCLSNFTVPYPGIGPIVGVQVQFDAKLTGVSGSGQVGISGVLAGYAATPRNTPALTTGLVTYVLGGPTDLWGVAPGQIVALGGNLIGFPLSLQATAILTGGSSYSATPNIQNVKVTIFWNAAGAAAEWTNVNGITGSGSPSQVALLDTSLSQWLAATQFNFNLPFGFILAGVQVSFTSGGGPGPDFLTFQLAAGGLRIGQAKSLNISPTGFFNAALGGPTDIWGTAPGLDLDLDALNDPSFGIMLMATGEIGSTVSVNNVQIKLWGTSTTNLELISYETSVLVGNNTYALTSLRRGILGSVPCDHPAASVFARLDQATIEYDVPGNFTGSTIFFKLCSFNAYGNQTQSLAIVTAYAVDILGLSPGAIDPVTGALRTGTPNFKVPSIEAVVDAAHGTFGIQNIPAGYAWMGIPTSGGSAPPVWQKVLSAGGGSGQVSNLFVIEVNVNTDAEAWDFLEVDTTLGPVTITMPPALQNSDVAIGVKKVSLDANPVIIVGSADPSSDDTIELQTQQEITTPGEAYTFMSDGDNPNWLIASSYLPAANPALGIIDSATGTLFPKIPVGGGAGQFGTGVANRLNVWLFRLDTQLSFNSLRFNLNSAAAGSVIGVGVYDQSGNRLVHWDNIPGTVANPNMLATPTGGAVLLEPGYYYWAFALSTTSTGAPVTEASVQTDGSQTNSMPYNRSLIRSGTAANPMASGVMPATLGTLTAGIETFLPYWTVEP